MRCNLDCSLPVLLHLLKVKASHISEWSLKPILLDKLSADLGLQSPYVHSGAGRTLEVSFRSH